MKHCTYSSVFSILLILILVICRNRGSHCGYLGAQEVEVSPVSAQVDEGVRSTEETQLVSITVGRGTVHLNTMSARMVGGTGGVRRRTYLTDRSVCFAERLVISIKAFPVP